MGKNKKINIKTIVTIFVIFLIYEFLIKPLLVGPINEILSLLIKFILSVVFYYLVGFVVNYKRKEKETLQQ